MSKKTKSIVAKSVNQTTIVSNGAPSKQGAQNKAHKARAQGRKREQAPLAIDAKSACLQALALCARSGKSKPSVTLKLDKDTADETGLAPVVQIGQRVFDKCPNIPSMFSTVGVTTALATHGAKPAGSLGVKEAGADSGYIHKETQVPATDLAQGILHLHNAGVIKR